MPTPSVILLGGMRTDCFYELSKNTLNKIKFSCAPKQQAKKYDFKKLCGIFSAQAPIKVAI